MYRLLNDLAEQAKQLNLVNTSKINRPYGGKFELNMYAFVVNIT